MQEVWGALRALISIADRVQDLSAQVRDLHKENQQLRERMVRLETWVELLAQSDERANRPMGQAARLSAPLSDRYAATLPDPPIDTSI